MPAVVKWGNYVKYAGRLMGRLDYAPKVSVGVTQVTVTFTLIYQSNNSATKHLTAQVQGDLTGSNSGAFPCPVGQLTTIGQWSRTVPLLYGKHQSIKVWGSVSGDANIPPFMIENVIPMMRFKKPVKPVVKKAKKKTTKPGGSGWLETGSTMPKIISALEWKGVPDESAPLNNFVVEKSTDGKNWEQVVATPNGFYTDPYVSVGHAYDYRIKAVGEGGESDWAYVPRIYMPPARPGSVSVSRTGTDVTVRWVNVGVGDYRTRVFRDGKLDAPVWEVAGGVDHVVLHDVPFDKPVSFAVRHVVFPEPDDEVDESKKDKPGNPNESKPGESKPEAGKPEETKPGDSKPSGDKEKTDPKKEYKPPVPDPVTGITKDGEVGILSAWFMLPAAQAPLAPDMLNPSNNWILPDTKTLKLSWRHNPLDYSAQTGFTIRLRDIDSGEFRELPKIVSDKPEYVLTSDEFPFKTAPQLEWQVATFGVGEGMRSPFSVSGFAHIDKIATSQITIPVDGSTVTSPILEVEGRCNADKPYSWKIELVETDTGRIVASAEGRETEKDTFKCRFDGLKDSRKYEIHSYAGSNLLTAGIVSRFVTGFAEQDAPSLQAVWDEDRGSTYLTVGNKDTHTANSEIARLEGEKWVPVATDLPLNAVITDFVPPLGGEIKYRVTASTKNGNSVYAYTTVTPSVRYIYLCSLDGQVWTALRWNPEHSRTLGLVNHAEQYFLGRDKPVLISGESTSRTVNLSGLMTRDEEKDYLPRWDRIATYGKPLLYRDPTGLSMWVSLRDISLQRERQSGLWTVSFSAVEVESENGTVGH